LGDEQPYQLSGLSGGQGEVARNILQKGRWFVENEDAPWPAAQRVRHHLVDPSDLDYTQANAHPRFQNLMLHMQGTALLLAGMWKVTGDQDFGYLQVLQVLLGALSVLVVYAISVRLFRRPAAALVAAALYALALQMAALMKIPFYDTWATLTVPPLVLVW